MDIHPSRTALKKEKLGPLVALKNMAKNYVEYDKDALEKTQREWENLETFWKSTLIRESRAGSDPETPLLLEKLNELRESYNDKLQYLRANHAKFHRKVRLINRIICRR